MEPAVINNVSTKNLATLILHGEEFSVIKTFHRPGLAEAGSGWQVCCYKPATILSTLAGAAPARYSSLVPGLCPSWAGWARRSLAR